MATTPHNKTFLERFGMTGLAMILVIGGVFLMFTVAGAIIGLPLAIIGLAIAGFGVIRRRA